MRWLFYGLIGLGLVTIAGVLALLAERDARAYSTTQAYYRRRHCGAHTCWHDYPKGGICC